MRNGEILEAEASRDLIVKDAVGHCGDYTEQNDFGSVHRIREETPNKH